MDDNGFFKLFAGAVIAWGLIVLAVWVAIISIGAYALFHYGVL